MNTKDEILKKLRAGEPFEKIRTGAHSISKLYEVAKVYLDEIEADLEAKRVEKSNLEDERSNLEAEVVALRSQVQRLNEEKRQLQQDKTKLNSELSEITAKLDSMKKSIDRFRAQGFTSEVMVKLEPMVGKGAAALLEQVESVEKYHAAMKDFAYLRESKARVLRQVQALKNEKRKIQASLVSLRNRIDELRLQARHVGDAVDVVVLLLKRGYSVEDIRSLGYGLDLLGVEGDPGLSISRLVTGLKRLKNLGILEEKVARKRQEDAELERAIEDKKRKLKILEEATLRSMNEVSNASIQGLRQTTSERQEALAATCQKFDAYVQASIANLQIHAKDRSEWVEEQLRRESELAQQRTLFQTELEYGRFYQAFFASDDFLSKISLPWILHASHRLHLWISMKLPNETIVPPSLFQTQLGLMNWPYNLTILAELVCCGLEKISQRNVQPKTSTVGAD